MKILGLDISTSIIGVAIVESANSITTPIFLDHIDLGNCKTFWEKVDKVTNYMSSLKEQDVAKGITKIGVEEALMSFSMGSSTAQTLTVLIAFNAVVRHTLRQIFCIDPQLVQATTARKKAGV